MRLAVRRERIRRGAILPWLVISLGVIVIVVALGTDGGRLLHERRSAQSAADAAALAAAADLFDNYIDNRGLDPHGSANLAAQASAATNGYTDGSGCQVTVNVPPRDGVFAGKNDFVEVIIRADVPRGFSGILGKGDLPVRARAVARGRPKNIGILALDPASAGALTNLTIGNVHVNGASTVTNSSNLLGLLLNGIGTFQADSHEVTGGVQLLSGILLGPVHTGVSPTTDPLRTFPPPDPATLSLRSAATLNINAAATLLPGIYRGGIQLGNGADVTMNTGIYYLDGGGFRVGGNAKLNADGVMMYNTAGAFPAGPIEFIGSGAVTFNPPASGIYTGLGVFQDRSMNLTVKVHGNAGTQITGAVYAPAAHLDVAGFGSTLANVVGGAHVGRTVGLSGLGSYRIDMGLKRLLIPDVGLVE